MKKPVVSYQLAYNSRRFVTLCADHAFTSREKLGPVSHGKRLGECDECALHPEDQTLTRESVCGACGGAGRYCDYHGANKGCACESDCAECWGKAS